MESPSRTMVYDVFLVLGGGGAAVGPPAGGGDVGVGVGLTSSVKNMLCAELWVASSLSKEASLSIVAPRTASGDSAAKLTSGWGIGETIVCWNGMSDSAAKTVERNSEASK